MQAGRQMCKPHFTHELVQTHSKSMVIYKRQRNTNSCLRTYGNNWFGSHCLELTGCSAEMAHLGKSRTDGSRKKSRSATLKILLWAKGTHCKSELIVSLTTGYIVYTIVYSCTLCSATISPVTMTLKQCNLLLAQCYNDTYTYY